MRVIHAQRERKKKFAFTITTLQIPPSYPPTLTGDKILNLLPPAKGSSSLQKLFFGRRPFFLSFLLSAAYIRERRRGLLFRRLEFQDPLLSFAGEQELLLRPKLMPIQGGAPFVPFSGLVFCVQDQVGTALFYYWWRRGDSVKKIRHPNNCLNYQQLLQSTISFLRPSYRKKQCSSSSIPSPPYLCGPARFATRAHICGKFMFVLNSPLGKKEHIS